MTIILLVGIIFFSASIIYLSELYKIEVAAVKVRYWLWMIPILIFLCSRLLPFALNGNHPLGYDTGFYNYSINKTRTEIEHNQSFILAKLFNSTELESPGSHLINKGLILLGLSNWSIIYVIYIIMGALAGLLIYLITKTYFDNLSALIAALLYSASYTQLLSYYALFWKNAIGIVLVLSIIYLLEKKEKKLWFIVLPTFLFLLITHKTSAIICILSLVAYFLSSSVYQLKYKLIGLVFLTACSAVFIWSNQVAFMSIWQLITTKSNTHDVFSLREGLFINLWQYINFAFIYIPFAIVTAKHLFKTKKSDNLVLYLGAISFVIVVFQLIFYRRVIIFLDIAAIILASPAIAKLYLIVRSKTTIRFASILFGALFIILLSRNFYWQYIQAPTLPETEIKNIESMALVYPELKIFVYDAYYTPWLYGFSGHAIVAPGWGDTGWNYDKWVVFWSTGMETRIEMIKDFTEDNKSIIIYSVDNDFSLINHSCLNRLKSHFYLLNC